MADTLSAHEKMTALALARTLRTKGRHNETAGAETLEMCATDPECNTEFWAEVARDTLRFFGPV